MFSDAVLLETIGELGRLYDRFPLESQLWARYGHQRSPYCALILFGLSPRTRDWLLVDMCRRFFDKFPSELSLLRAWSDHSQAVKDIVRKGQLPFIESAAKVIQDNGRIVPPDPNVLMMIKGVGEKVTECVMAYGWGREALPVDGNVCRAAGRLLGLSLASSRSQASNIREQLKEVYLRHRVELAARGIAMTDIHELFRLHGQAVCTEAPKCRQCPLSSCQLRQHSYAAAGPAVSPALWQEWRDLLLDSSCGKIPGK